MAESEGGVRSEWPDRHESGIGVHAANGLFGDEVAAKPEAIAGNMKSGSRGIRCPTPCDIDPVCGFTMGTSTFLSARMPTKIRTYVPAPETPLVKRTKVRSGHPGGALSPTFAPAEAECSGT